MQEKSNQCDLLLMEAPLKTQRQNGKTNCHLPLLAEGCESETCFVGWKGKSGVQGRLAPRWDLFLGPGKTGKIGCVSVDLCYLTHARWHQTHLSTDGFGSEFPREVSVHHWVPNSSYLVLDPYFWHRTLIGSHGNSSQIGLLVKENASSSGAQRRQAARRCGQASRPLVFWPCHPHGHLHSKQVPWRSCCFPFTCPESGYPLPRYWARVLNLGPTGPFQSQFPCW